MNITCGNCRQTNAYYLWEIIDDTYWCPECKVGVRRTAGKPTAITVDGKQMIIPGEIKLERRL